MESPRKTLKTNMCVCVCVCIYQLSTIFFILLCKGLYCIILLRQKKVTLGSSSQQQPGF